MSKNESVKAQLDFLKGLIYLLITAIFTICGYFATTYKVATLLDLAFVLGALAFLGILLFISFKVQKTKIKELENLKERK